MNLIAAVRAEIAKVLTTKIWWILLVVLFTYVAFLAALLGFAFTVELPAPSGPSSAPPVLPADAVAPVVYGIAHSIGYVFPLMLGTLSVTGEFRHQTLTPTFLATPKRSLVLIAKLIVMALFGVLYGVVALLASVVPGASLISLSDGITGLGDSETWLLFARVVLAMTLWALIGVGVGALIPNQVAAIVVVLAFTQFVEPVLRTVASFVDWAADIGRYLPGAAGDALVGSSIFNTMGMSGAEAVVLDWWQGGLLLVAYAIVATIVGYLVAWRSDVT